MGVGALGVLSSGTLPFAAFLQKKRRAFKEAFWRIGLVEPIHFLLIHTWFKQRGAHGRIWASCTTDLRVDDLWADPLAMATIDGQASAGSDRAYWFAAATLFVTLIFPIQFQHQWLTIGWAMEGAALIWLYRSIPHRGLLMAGSSLLAVAFLRLSLNPAILSYEARGDWALFN